MVSLKFIYSFLFHFMKCVFKKVTMLLFIVLSCVLILYMLQKQLYEGYFFNMYRGFPNGTEQTINKTVLSINAPKVSLKEGRTIIETKMSASKSKYMNTIEKASKDQSLKIDINDRSRTKPKFYPVNGTGKAVDINNKYDFDLFNSFCNVEWAMVAVLPVYSAPENIKKRQAIRETVGRECTYIKCRIFFVVGISLNDSLNKKVEQEYHKEKDILIDSNRIDTYRDCNNKVVAMLDLLIKYCPTPKYVIHFIDDAYPNLRTIIDQLDRIDNNRYILGLRCPVSVPFRDPKHKWYTSVDEWPYPRYPAYISGPTYSFLNNDSKLLRDHVHLAEYVWHEDIWFTGLVAKEAGFTLISLNKRFANSVPQLTQQNWNSYSLIHHVTTEKYYWIYNNTAKRDNSTG